MTLTPAFASDATLPSQVDIFSSAQPNPLGTGFPGPLGFQGWSNALFNNATPWAGSLFPTAQSYRLLKKVKNVFVPSVQDVELAMNIHLAMLESIDMADPRRPENRELRYKYGFERCEMIGLMPYQQEGAAGAIIKGPPGSGKSSFMNRFTSLIPQVIEHKNNGEYGWISFKQLLWVRAEMPADGSRSGLIKSIAIAMDIALGTDYVNQLAKMPRVETQFGSLLYWLGLHCCSLIILEEAQKENLNTPVLGRQIVKFFLRLLNIGTPVVLIGNPNAFAELEADSQDLSRFSEIGIYEYYPEMDWESERWNDLVTYVWGYTVFPENKDPLIEGLSKLLWDCTGGIPRFLARLRRLSLYQALILGNDFVDGDAIALAVEMEPMQNIQGLVDAYANRDAKKLMAFPDQPFRVLEARWIHFEAGKKLRKEGQLAAVHDSGDDRETGQAQRASTTNIRPTKKATLNRPIAPRRSTTNAFKSSAPPQEAT